MNIITIELLQGHRSNVLYILKHFSGMMNYIFTARPWHPEIKAPPMDWNCSERNHVAASAACPPTFPPAPSVWNDEPQAPFQTSFSSHIRYQHPMVWYLFQLEPLHLLLLQDGILNQPRLHSSILLICLIMCGVPIAVTGYH